jgi:hypothetical protein
MRARSTAISRPTASSIATLPTVNTTVVQRE